MPLKCKQESGKSLSPAVELCKQFVQPFIHDRFKNMNNEQKALLVLGLTVFRYSIYNDTETIPVATATYTREITDQQRNLFIRQESRGYKSSTLPAKRFLR